MIKRCNKKRPSKKNRKRLSKPWNAFIDTQFDIMQCFALVTLHQFEVMQNLMRGYQYNILQTFIILFDDCLLFLNLNVFSYIRSRIYDLLRTTGQTIGCPKKWKPCVLSRKSFIINIVLSWLLIEKSIFPFPLQAAYTKYKP